MFFLQVARPIRVILDRWIYEGELDDLYNEVSTCQNKMNVTEKMKINVYLVTSIGAKVKKSESPTGLNP